jgi:hypothetical protein
VYLNSDSSPRLGLTVFLSTHTGELAGEDLVDLEDHWESLQMMFPQLKEDRKSIIVEPIASVQNVRVEELV